MFIDTVRARDEKSGGKPTQSKTKFSIFLGIPYSPLVIALCCIFAQVSADSPGSEEQPSIAQDVFEIVGDSAEALLSDNKEQSVDEAKVAKQASQLQAQMPAIYTETAYSNAGASTASALPPYDGYGFFGTLDFLWWKLYEDGTHLAVKKQSSGKNHGHVEDLNFQWEPGFKIGAGMDLDFYDGWDAYVNFTFYRTHASKSSHAQGQHVLLTSIGLKGQEASKASASWHVHFYDLDLSLGRNYFVSKYLSLHPFFGLTTLWIGQHLHAHYLTTASQHQKIKGKNNFWGIGPRLGVGGQCYLGEHISLYTDVSGALYWGDFDVRLRERTPSSELFDIKADLNRIAPAIALGLGGAYETAFGDNAYYLTFKIGYEAQYYWRQNQLPNPYLPSYSYDRYSEDLAMMGLTAEMRLDF